MLSSDCNSLFSVLESLCENTHSCPFHRVTDEMGKPVFVVKTCPFFMQYPQLSIYYDWHILPMENFSRTNSNMIQSVYNPGISYRQVASLPDPGHLYSSLLGGAGMEDCVINCPNIRDGDGHLIFPGEYTNALKDGTIVLVNVSPSL